jgi:hypothetical protein
MSGFNDFKQVMNGNKRKESESWMVPTGELARPSLRVRSSSIVGFDFTGAAVQMMAPDEKTSVTWTDRKSGMVTEVKGTNSNVLHLMGHIKTSDGVPITIDAESLNENKALNAEIAELTGRNTVLLSNNTRLEREMRKVTGDVQETKDENNELRRIGCAMNDEHQVLQVEHQVLQVKAKKMLQMLQAFVKGDNDLLSAMNAQDPTILREAASQ